MPDVGAASKLAAPTVTARACATHPPATNALRSAMRKVHHVMKLRETKSRTRAIASGAVALAATGAAMIAFAAPAASGSARAAASSVLTMESSQETTLTDNFNPFVSTSAANTVGATSLIYEPLLQFDIAKPLTAPYDFLASAFKWGAGGKSITFTIRS